MEKTCEDHGECNYPTCTGTDCVESSNYLERKAKGVPSISEWLKKFENGEERYQKDATFNRVVDALSTGYDPIKLLDIVMKQNEEWSSKFIELVKRSPMPPIVIKTEE